MSSRNSSAMEAPKADLIDLRSIFDPRSAQMSRTVTRDAVRRRSRLSPRARVLSCPNAAIAS